MIDFCEGKHDQCPAFRNGYWCECDCHHREVSDDNCSHSERSSFEPFQCSDCGHVDQSQHEDDEPHTREATVKVYLTLGDDGKWFVAGSTLDGYALDADVYCSESCSEHDENYEGIPSFPNVWELHDMIDEAITGVLNEAQDLQVKNDQ